MPAIIANEVIFDNIPCKTIGLRLCSFDSGYNDSNSVKVEFNTASDNNGQFFKTGKRKDKVAPKREWIEKLVYLCKKAEIPIFMKSSLAEIWGEQLIQEFPEQLMRNK